MIIHTWDEGTVCTQTKMDLRETALQSFIIESNHLYKPPNNMV